MPEASSKIDDLISNLEEAIEATDDIDFTASAEVGPKPATFKVTSVSFGAVSERNKLRQANVVQISNGTAHLHARENIVKGFELDMTMFYEKNRVGEVLYRCTGEIVSSQKVSGGYSLRMEFKSIDKISIPAYRRMIEFAASGDFAGWNRWSSSLKEGALLRDIDLSNMDLKYFDLCCANMEECNFQNADLSYCNLSGANLKGCNLDNVNFTGADLFKVKIPRKYMALLTASGIVEIESVVLIQ